MKKWFFNIPVKLIALILATLCLFCTVTSGIGIVTLLYEDGYRAGLEEVRENTLRSRYDWLPDRILYLYREEKGYFEAYLDDFDSQLDIFCIISSGERLLYSNYYGEEYTVRFSERYYFSASESYEEEEHYEVEVYLSEPYPGSNLETELELLEFFWRIRYGLIAIFASCAVASLALCIFLCFAAGRRGEHAPKLHFFHRVPLEIYLAGGFFAILVEMWFYDIAPAQFWFVLLFLSIFFLLDAFLVLLLLMTFAARCKSRNLLATSFCGKAWFFLKRSSHILRRLWEDVRLVPKIVFVMACVALFDLMLAGVLDFTECLAAFLIEGIVLSGVLVWYAAAAQRLEKDVEKIALGDLNHRCDLSRLPPGLRSFGEKLNSSAEGMEKAVEEKIKSERFKTELITNVSHDIKTPLTSIVNFVDLMKKEDSDNPKICEYLEVLDRQATRLKKLTEDLVESSKAASGVLPVELARCDAGVLLEQAMGEYREQLEEKGLTPCLALPETPCYILADGKRLWRVMDNLFQNITKYALSGTRVYVSLEERGEKIEMVFRNISAQPLALSGEHLSERFVRGDLSRNTEGSGLGLAIARSLTELQKGSLSLTVDGDLFKAVITFDRIQ